jgi:transcriptional regulator with XRE-family HTH domain
MGNSRHRRPVARRALAIGILDSGRESKDIAAEVGIKADALSAIVRGRTRLPRAEVMFALARALNVEVEVLFPELGDDAALTTAEN